MVREIYYEEAYAVKYYGDEWCYGRYGKLAGSKVSHAGKVVEQRK